MLARRGITLIPEDVELSLKNAKMKDDLYQLKSSSAVTVKERPFVQKAGGAVHVDMDNVDELNSLSNRDTLMCTSLTMKMPHLYCATDLFFLLEYCFPFLKTLTLDLGADDPESYHHHLQLSQIERLLRFNNFPVLTQIRVASGA